MAVNVRYGQSAGALGIASNGTTAVTIYTFGASLKMPDGAAGPGGIVDKVRLYNADTVVHRVELHLVPNGDTADYDTLIENITLGVGEVFHYAGGDRMPSQATIQIKLGEAHTTRAVYARPDVSELY
jgi:hypothetical protein